MTRQIGRSFIGALVLLACLFASALAQTQFSIDPLLIRLDGETRNAVMTITTPS